jgi:hypothetical protein
MTTTELLTRPLECTGSNAERHLVPAGYAVTVHHSDGPRWIVVLDGRVYRAVVEAVQEATR